MLHMDSKAIKGQLDRRDEEKYTYLYVNISLEPLIKVELSKDFNVFPGADNANREKALWRE